MSSIHSSYNIDNMVKDSSESKPVKLENWCAEQRTSGIRLAARCGLDLAVHSL